MIYNNNNMENFKEYDIKNSIWKVPERYSNLKVIFKTLI
jgi:hypothetical protein